MLPVHRSNLELANECLTSLLENSDLNIICIDDFGKDSDYVNKDNRVKFIHNEFESRQPLVKIWNQCIKECPTENVIIASWRQRPTREHFKIIEEKINDNFGLVTFDGLHFFSFHKSLTKIVGFFDEGFTKGQYEDTDWFNRMRMNNISMYVGDVPEQRMINGNYVHSTWREGYEENKNYYESKWGEDILENKLIQKKEEYNINDRNYFSELEIKNFRPFSDSILNHNLSNYYNNLFYNLEKKF